MSSRLSPPELSSAEATVYYWLSKNRIPFTYQVNMYGGTSEKGGAKIDFVLVDRNIIIRVQSYWHTTEEAKARDFLQRIELENDGYMVVDVWESQLKENAKLVLSKAIQGIQLDAKA